MRKVQFHVLPFRFDPAGVTERLDKQLAAADRQSEQLIAPSEARQAWNSTLIIQALLVALGTGSIGAAVWSKWRTR